MTPRGHLQSITAALARYARNSEPALLNECKTNYGLNDRYFEPPLPPLMRGDIESTLDAARFLAGDRSPRLPAIGRTRKEPRADRGQAR
jgi:hypothetical protein